VSACHFFKKKVLNLAEERPIKGYMKRK